MREKPLKYLTISKVACLDRQWGKTLGTTVFLFFLVGLSFSLPLELMFIRRFQETRCHKRLFKGLKISRVYFCSSLLWALKIQAFLKLDVVPKRNTVKQQQILLLPVRFVSDNTLKGQGLQVIKGGNLHTHCFIKIISHLIGQIKEKQIKGGYLVFS